jgi:HK97 gp10 family phage protein
MVTLKFEGGSELAAALSELSLKLSSRLLREVLAEAGEPIRKTASSLAPRRSPAPNIADNIAISRAQTEDQAAVKIGPAKGFAYGLPLEIGTRKMQAHPFLRPAFEANRDRSLGIVRDALWRELAGKGIQRPTDYNDSDVDEGGGLKRHQLSKDVFKGKQRQRKPKAKP